MQQNNFIQFVCSLDIYNTFADIDSFRHHTFQHITIIFHIEEIISDIHNFTQQLDTSLWMIEILLLHFIHYIEGIK